MTKSFAVFKAGTRDSKLSRIQTRNALGHLQALLPGVRFRMVPMSSPGDRDRARDLRESPEDFFTRDLDEAVLDGTVDCAVHSAKDVPYPVRDGLDWVWLPRARSRHDALVLPRGASADELPPEPRIGISSERRENYARRRWPNARIMPIRGNVEDRVRQVDEGRYDAMITAACALERLGMAGRITERIPLHELDTPEAQGTIALTFRADDARLPKVRSLFTPAVTFAGAGTSAGTCTLHAAEALRHCDACLYDALADGALLDLLPEHAAAYDVGKRAGGKRTEQPQINELLGRLAREGKRVVRLKGGDPGIFGRLAEEVEALDALRLPYRVIPGVSSLNALAAAGVMLTERAVSRGLCVMTARKQGGAVADVTAGRRAELPLVFFMGTKVADRLAAQLLAEGMDPQTPAAFVYGAGGSRQTVVRCTLADVPPQRPAAAEGLPGLFIVGEPAGGEFADCSALGGRRVLVTCSDALQDRAGCAVESLGGIALRTPLIRLVPEDSAVDTLRGVSDFDWLVLTSPSSVRCLFALMPRAGIDVRRLPRVLGCGSGTSRELRERHVQPDAEPDSAFGGEGVLEVAGQCIQPADRVLRLRSDRAGGALAEGLRRTGADVTDVVLYRNQPVRYNELPDFDAAFFASSSAVDAFVSQWGAEALEDCTLCTIGGPTARRLAGHGLSADVVSPESTVETAVSALAGFYVGQSLEEQT